MKNTDPKLFNILSNIYYKISDNFDKVSYNNLYRGKMGSVIFLYHYSRFINDCKIKQKAHEILENVWSDIGTIPLSLQFKYGLAGIIFGIDYLFRKGFLPQEDPYILDEFDNFFFQKKIYHTHQIDNDEGGFGLPLYFINRFDFFFKNGDTGKCDFLSHIILSLVDDCENIITSCEFQEKNKHSLSFLSSLIAFILKVHHRGFNIDKTQCFINHLLFKVKVEQKIFKQESGMLNLLYNRLSSVESNQKRDLIKKNENYFLELDLKMICQLACLELVQESNLIVGHLVPYNEFLNLGCDYSFDTLDLSFEKGLSGLGYYLIKNNNRLKE